MNILLISNMYPNEKSPFYGSFVKNCEKTIIDNKIKVSRVVIDKKSKNKTHKIYTYLCFYFSILNNLFFNKYDYVYAHYVSHVSLPLLFYTLFNKKLKIIVHVHGGDVKKLEGTSSFFFKIKRILSNSILKKSYKIIVPSVSYKYFVIDEYNSIDSNNISVYPSGGVNIKFFHPGDLNVRNKKKLGFAGRLIKSKNVDLIINALLENKKFSLDIVGQGPELSNLTSEVKRLKLENRVNFYPAMSQLELADWYRSIDCLVYPSDSESLGLVPIEAIACGVKVILSKIPAFQELRNNGFEIFLMENISSESISMQLNNLNYINDDDLSNNIKLIRDFYCSKEIKKDLINVFQ